MDEICTNRRTPACSAASAINTEALRPAVVVRGMPLPRPAHAANTTASAPSR
jgi:hypothetical protein